MMQTMRLSKQAGVPFGGMKLRLVDGILALVIQLHSSIAAAATPPSNFALIKLSRGISLEVPNGWRLLSYDAKRIIDTSTEAALDLSGIERPAGHEVNLIAANSTPASTYAAVRVDLNMPSLIHPSVFAQVTAQDIRDLSIETERSLRLTLPQVGLTLVEFLGMRVEKISGFPALVTEYRRSGPKGPVFVQLLQVYTAKHSFKINLSYRESEVILWKPVLRKIRSSIAVK